MSPLVVGEQDRPELGEAVAGMVTACRVSALGLLAVPAAAGAFRVSARFGVGDFIAERVTKFEEVERVGVAPERRGRYDPG
jgi:hypothetical protein